MLNFWWVPSLKLTVSHGKSTILMVFTRKHGDFHGLCMLVYREGIHGQFNPPAPKQPWGFLARFLHLELSGSGNLLLKGDPRAAHLEPHGAPKTGWLFILQILYMANLLKNVCNLDVSLFLRRILRCYMIFWGDLFPMASDTTSNTLPETNIAPENRPGPKRKLIFQPSIFRCEPLVSGRVTKSILMLFLCFPPLKPPFVVFKHSPPAPMRNSLCGAPGSIRISFFWVEFRVAQVIRCFLSKENNGWELKLFERTCIYIYTIRIYIYILYIYIRIVYIITYTYKYTCRRRNCACIRANFF